MIYAFDLDSTLTKKETLPFLAKKLGNEAAYNKICEATANLPYSFALEKRLAIFFDYPTKQVEDVLSSIPIFSKLQEFIKGNGENSYIITSNLDIYVKKLCDKFCCKVFSSTIKNDKIQIIDKEKIVKKLQQKDMVCFMGDGENDANALKAADFSVAASYAKKANISAIRAAKFEALTEIDALMYLKSLPK